MRKLLTLLAAIIILGDAAPAMAAIGFNFDDAFDKDRTITGLLQVFGGAINDEYPETVISLIFREYTTSVLTVAYGWLLYLTVLAVGNSAKDGEVWGKQWNGTWGPIRTLSAVALASPIFKSGFPGIVYIILFSAKIGVTIANGMWNVGVDGLANRIVPLSTPNHSASIDFARQLFEMQLCIETYNEANKAYGWDAPITMEKVNIAPANVRIWRSSGNRRIAAGDCGRLTIDFQAMVGGNGIVNDYTPGQQLQKVQDIHQTAVAQLLGDIKPVVQKIAAAAINPKTEEAVNNKVTDAELSAVTASLLAYDYSVLGTAQYITDEYGNNLRQKFAKSAKACGWSCAGTFWLETSRINGRTLNATRYRPVVRVPEIENLARNPKIRQVSNAYVKGLDNAKPMWGVVDSKQDSVTPFSAKATEASTNQDMDYVRRLLADKYWSVIAPTILSAGLGSDAELNFHPVVSVLGASASVPVLEANRNASQRSKDINYATLRSSLRNRMSASDASAANILPQDRLFDTYIAEGTIDPISRFTDFGHALIDTSVGTQFTLIGLQAVAAGVDGAAGSFWGQLAWAQTATKAAKTFIDGVTDWAEPFVWIMLGAGIYFAFVIPYLVWLHYLLAVLGWMILVFEAAVAGPIWMIVHMTFKGDEFIDHKMIPGWLILLTIIIKPALIVFGFWLSIVIFYVGSAFIQADFGRMMIDIIGNHSTGLITAVVFTVLMMAAYVVVSKLSFRLMTVLPDNIIARWMGGPSLAPREEADAEAAAGAIGTARGAQASMGAGAVKAAGKVIGGGAVAAAKGARRVAGESSGEVDVQMSAPMGDSRGGGGSEGKQQGRDDKPV